MMFRKYFRTINNNSNQDDLMLPISSYYNGGAINLEVDSYNSFLCWLKSIDNRTIVCSNLNGEKATILFSLENHSENIAGFAIDPFSNTLFVMLMVSLQSISAISILLQNNSVSIIEFKVLTMYNFSDIGTGYGKNKTRQ